MQVNLSANLPNSTVEAPATSTEKTDSGTASAFFAQMDQIWNLNSKDNNAPTGEKSVEQIPDATGPNPLTLLLGTSLISGKSVETEPAPALSVSDPAANDTPAANTAVHRQIADEDASNPTLPALPEFLHSQTGKGKKGTAGFLASQTDLPPGEPIIQSVSEIEVMPAIVPDPEKKTAGNMQRVESFWVATPPASSGCVPDLSRNPQDSGSLSEDPRIALSGRSDSTIPASTNLSPDQGIPQVMLSEPETKDPGSTGDPKLVQDSKPPKGNFQEAVAPAARTADARAVQDTARTEAVLWKAVQSDVESAQPNFAFPQVVKFESLDQLRSRSESNSLSEDSGRAGDFMMAQDSNPQSESSQTAVSKKLQDMVRTALEDMGAGTPRADQNASRNEGFSATLQNRLEISQLESGRPRTSVSDRHSEMLTQFLSGPARVTESSNTAGSSQGQIPTARSNEFIFQVAERIQIQVREGKNQIRIQLKPDSLGRLEIRAESTAVGVVARITTESGNVKSYLENNLHLLQQTLQDQGLKVDRIHIVVDDGFDSSSSSGYTAQSGYAGSGQHEGDSRGFSGISGSAADQLEEMAATDAITWISLNPNIRFHTIA